MKHNVKNWIKLTALSSALVLSACGGGGGGGSNPGSGSDNSGGGSSAGDITFDRQALLTNIGQNVFQPSYSAFQTSSSALTSSIQSYCAAIGSDTESSALVSAQSAWRTTMSDWQKAEMTQLGPLADASGQLRNNIYSWPLISSCSVDQEVIEAEADAYDISSRAVNRRGLDAIEYVLFSDSLNHTCSANITAVSEWNDREDTAKKTARCDFATIAAQDVAAQATT